jgi:alpha-tubulin suppressor-like RCC1 family protein
MNVKSLLVIIITFFSGTISEARSLVAAGNGSSYVIDKYSIENNELNGMGLNDKGQIGNGTTANVLTAYVMATNVLDVQAWGKTVMFLKSDGTLWGCGDNSGGLIKVLGPVNYLRPYQFENGVKDFNFSADNVLTILKESGLLIKRSVTFLSSTDTVISNSVSSFDAKGEQIIYKTTDGTLWGYGSNNYGQLGNGTTSTFQNSKINIASIVDYKVVSQFNSAAVNLSGDLYYWGASDYRYQGALVRNDILVPQVMVRDIKSIPVGDSTSLVYIKNDNSLWVQGKRIADNVAYYARNETSDHSIILHKYFIIAN